MPAGEGDYSPDSGRIDYRLAATVASSIKRRNAGELAELRGVTVPVSVSGPWAAPSIALNFAAASGEIVTRRIAAKAAERAVLAAAALPVAKITAPAKKLPAKMRTAKKKPAKAIKKKTTAPGQPENS